MRNVQQSFEFNSQPFLLVYTFIWLISHFNANLIMVLIERLFVPYPDGIRPKIPSNFVGLLWRQRLVNIWNNFYKQLHGTHTDRLDTHSMANDCLVVVVVLLPPISLMAPKAEQKVTQIEWNYAGAVTYQNQKRYGQTKIHCRKCARCASVRGLLCFKQKKWRSQHKCIQFWHFFLGVICIKQYFDGI